MAPTQICISRIAAAEGEGRRRVHVANRLKLIDEV